MVRNVGKVSLKGSPKVKNVERSRSEGRQRLKSWKGLVKSGSKGQKCGKGLVKSHPGGHTLRKVCLKGLQGLFSGSGQVRPRTGGGMDPLLGLGAFVGSAVMSA